MPATVPPCFGDLVRSWRKGRGLTQEELALRAGLSTRHMSFLETGRARPSLGSVAAIADALELRRTGEDALRAAAGFAPRDSGAPRSRPSELLWDTALAVDEAITADQVVATAAPLLWQLGLDRFFVATVRSEGQRLTFEETGTFPTVWARNYSKLRYDSSDPLLTEALSGRSSFYWGDILPGRSLAAPARQMFGSAAQAGVNSGFVAALPDGSGGARIVSMMGRGVDEKDPSLRLALRTLGWSMIARISELKNGPGGRLNNRQPPGPSPLPNSNGRRWVCSAGKKPEG